MEELEKTLAQEFGDDISDSETEMEEDINNLYCVACNKMFKTPKSFENHESSRKHKENVELLKATILEEESSQKDVDEDEVADYFIAKDDLDTENKSGNESDLSEDLELNEHDCNIQGETKSKKKKKQKNVISLDENEDLENIDVLKEFVDDSDNDDFHSNKKQKKGKRKSNKEKPNNSSMDFYEEEENYSIEKEKSKKSKKNRKNKKDNVEILNDIDLSHNCLKCTTVFSSKNKLFEHLKKTGHGVYIDPSLKNKTKQNVKN